MDEKFKRDHHCGELTKQDAGQEVVLCGWVATRRDHGGLIFIDLRDRSGGVQGVIDPAAGESFKKAEAVRSEYVLQVFGKVRERSAETINPNIATGTIEVVASELNILNPANTPPFYIEDGIDTDENLRLRYRYLDLRRPEMQKNFILRHKVTKLMRDYLDKHGFLEIETPMLCRSTPEGARDYLVPSRVNPGKFYALPQSPQQYKQLLMIAGMDRYCQVAKSFRDEDLHADRQPEFTQIDVEMSFVDQDDVMEMFDGFVTDVMGKVWNFTPPRHIRRMKYAEAMLKYGSDKPDLRFALEIHDVSEIAAQSNFGVLKNVVAAGGKVRGIAAKGCVDFTRKQIDDLTTHVGRYGAKGLVWMRVKENDVVETQVGKFFTTEQLNAFRDEVGAKCGDMMFFIAGPERVAATAMGQLRL